ncbi:MAG: hypothetical protein ACNA7Q_14915 [Rhodobacterales bacterium]
MPHPKVTRRKVFYIPGYDPIHPRRYRELYRKEGAEQAAISGYSLTLSPKSGKGAYGWQVDASFDADQVHAEIDVLIWSDIVRDSMSNSIPSTYLQLFRTAWIYIGSGALGRLMRLRKGPLIAALYPVVFLLWQLGFALLAGWVLFRLAGYAAKQIGLDGQGAGQIILLIGAGAGLMAAWGVLRWFRARDGRFFAYYLMHDFAFSAHLGGGYPPALERRMAQFGDLIADALQEPVDEVLIVGHSSGAHLAVSLLADLLRDGRVPSQGPALALLSLGQVVPMVSFLPDAQRLRADLQYLSETEALCWVDVTAPGDGCAFALCDPVTVSGVARAGKRWPLVLSAAFTQTLSPERWKTLRWRFFRLHFQYLCAFDRPDHYDYFAITAGPKRLADRYHGRAASKSRIDRAVSGHVSVAA